MATPASEAAVPPADVSEREALEGEVTGLSSMLGRIDSSPTLSALLKVIARARVLGAEGFVVLKAFASRLRENRAFDDLYILTTEMRAAGMTDLDIRRWEIQALIEMGVFETALDLARPLIASGPTTREGQDGYSALGRIYKQMYMDAAAGRSQAEPELRAIYLERSYAAYLRVWQAQKAETTAYYGVNALAVARRAIDDRLTPDDPAKQAETARAMAEDVFAVVSRPTLVWSWATQGEALIALGRYDEAARAYAAFATSGEVSLFQLSSSLRQLEEVWRIDGADPNRGAPVRLLKAVILSKLAGGGDATAPGGAPRSASVTISPREAQLIRQDFDAPPASATPARGAQPSDPKGFERIFSVNAPVAIQVIRNAMTRARAICRIHANIGGRDTPFATGFTVEGRLLHESWGSDPVIVTNNHVISSRPGPGGQRAEYCEAVFIDPETDEMRRVGFSAVMWESEQDAHDITILKPATALPAHVLPLKQLPRAPLPPPAVDDEGIGRVYVIGFPAAGELSFSFADNVLLDHNAPGNCEICVHEGGVREVKGVPSEPVRLHYRTPTLGGSSGSPVFDFNDFSLLGVHHRGLPDFRRLNGRPGAYAANEGIWIESIRAAIDESEAEETEASYLGEAGRRWRSLRVQAAPRAPVDPVLATQSVSSIPIGQISVAPRPRGPALIFPGAAGDMAAGYSPVAAQILKSGRASAAEIAAASNESIIGIDDRTRIFETAMAPWRMVCAIRCWWGSRLAVGTGALIAPGLVLTAGHVLIPRERRTVPDRIEVIPALNGPQKPYGDAPVASISVHPRWLTSFNIADDVGVIHLAKPLGHQLGWFATASRPEDDLRSVWAHITGYPGEKLDQPTDPSGHAMPPVQAAQLWHHSAPILNVQNRRIFYAADTTPGQSGAPIYILDPAVSPTPVIIGVHAYGKASTPVAVGQANSGAWLDAEMFDLIAQWRQESDAVLARGGAPA